MWEQKYINTLYFKTHSVLVLWQLVHIFTTTACHNSGTCRLAVLIVIAHIDVTYRIKLTFCAFTPIHRSIQKPAQLLRWANSPHDCSHSAVRNSPRDQLPPTGWVLHFRDSNIIVTSTKMQRKHHVRFLSVSMCSATSLVPPTSKRKSSFACTRNFRYWKTEVVSSRYRAHRSAFAMWNKPGTS